MWNHPELSVCVQVCGPPGMMKHLSGEKPKPREQGEVLIPSTKRI